MQSAASQESHSWLGKEGWGCFVQALFSILLYWEGAVKAVSSLVFKVTNPEPGSDIFLAFSEEHHWEFRFLGSTDVEWHGLH